MQCTNSRFSRNCVKYVLNSELGFYYTYYQHSTVYALHSTSTLTILKMLSLNIFCVLFLYSQTLRQPREALPVNETHEGMLRLPFFSTLILLKNFRLRISLFLIISDYKLISDALRLRLFK